MGWCGGIGAGEGRGERRERRERRGVEAHGRCVHALIYNTSPSPYRGIGTDSERGEYKLPKEM